MKMKKNTLLKNTFRKFILKCIICTAIVIVLGYLFGFIVRMVLYTLLPSEGYLYFRMLYMSVFVIITWVICMIVLIYKQLKKVFSYITELQNASNQLLDKNIDYIELSPELREFETEINKLKHESEKNERLARESEQRKNDLIVYLAHDLKTPLTSVIGYLELLKESPDLPLEQRVKYTGITLDKAYRLEDLMNEFFEIARFNDTKIVLMKKNLNVKFMLEQIVDEFYPITNEQEKNIEINCDDKIVIYADPDKLSRALNNVIKNAISYSFENTTINISVEHTNGQVIISITNDGYTIPEDKLNSIFEKFYRLDDARNTQKGGAGLGLAIAKEIITSHGGSISAKSKDNKTTFTLVMPENENSIS